MTRQQIYAWRQEFKRRGLLSPLPVALFLPVELDRQTKLAVPVPIADTAVRHPAQIELQLANGRCLRFDPAVDAMALKQVIQAVEVA